VRSEERLSALAEETIVLQTRIVALRQEVEQLHEPPQRHLPIATPSRSSKHVGAIAPAPSTSAEKVALFRDLFRGRLSRDDGDGHGALPKPHYHQISDRPDTLDHSRFACVVAGLERVLDDLANARIP